MTIGGTWGKIVHVNLTNSETWIETPPDDMYAKLVGGRALVAYLLLRHTEAGVDPLGPQNLMIFAPGALQGSSIPGAGRHGIGGKSPLTGALASSEAGGWWGHEFKRTGFDALVVHGKAAHPAYLWIKDGEVEIRSAKHLWGRDTAEVEEAIRGELADDRVRVTQCGIAGENLVLYANVINDVNRAAGRNGLGAVMGSKMLKAVAVRGTLRPSMAERDRTKEVTKWLGDNYKTLSAWAVDIGTPGSVASLSRTGGLPTRNFRDPVFEASDSISGELMQRTILKGRDTCHACPVQCKQIVGYDGETFPDESAFRTSVSDTHIDEVYGGPEYESLGALGSACGIDDLVAVSKANELSARWGLDTISLGMTIAFVMECVENGLLTAEQTGGFLPRWGDAAALLEATDMIAHRRDFGAQMALGSKRLADQIGPEAQKLLVEVKGQELPMHEPRLKFALGVGYATAPVGADHMMAFHDTGYTHPGRSLERVNAVYKVGPLPATDLGKEKMELFYHEVNWVHFQDCALVCMFYPYDYTHLSEALSGVTGCEYTPRDILAVGERCQHLSRLYNLREGFTADDDRLPKRVMKAFESGPLAGLEITDEALYGARQMWYEMMGWTPEGVPTEERLAELGLFELLP